MTTERPSAETERAQYLLPPDLVDEMAFERISVRPRLSPSKFATMLLRLGLETYRARKAESAAV